MGIIKKINRLLQKHKYKSISKSRSAWDKQFKGGDWECLASKSKMAHYMVIVGCVASFKKRPDILDVGCGQGMLLQYLKQENYNTYYIKGLPPAPICYVGRKTIEIVLENYNTYLGIDFSSEALKQARKYKNNETKFNLSKIEDWITVNKYNIIIFNESIYYVKNPIETLTKYNNYLADGGVFIVSVCRYKHNHKIWKILEKRFNAEYEFQVSGIGEMEWDVKILSKYTQ